MTDDRGNGTFAFMEHGEDQGELSCRMRSLTLRTKTLPRTEHKGASSRSFRSSRARSSCALLGKSLSQLPYTKRTPIRLRVAFASPRTSTRLTLPVLLLFSLPVRLQHAFPQCYQALPFGRTPGLRENYQYRRPLCASAEAAMTSTLTPPPTHDLELIERVMKDVYGDWTTDNFPKPLPKREAGDSPTGQRRYLWTDAFGVLNFVTLARRAAERDQGQAREVYLHAAKRLIDAVHLCLANPSSSKFPMSKDQMGQYKGLRIGKPTTKIPTDNGMTYDGMYWHYLDKWMFALARYGREAEDYFAIERAVTLIREVHPAFFVPGEGIYWKLSVDLTPPRGARPHLGDDLLSACIVYHVVQAAGGDVSKEIADLAPLMATYAHQLPYVSSDPLGLGLMAWKMQWCGGWANGRRAAIRRLLPEAFDPRVGMQLPFRLYGGIIGGKLMRVQGSEEVLEQVKAIEMSTQCGEMEHSAINKVMFASALDPLAFTRLPEEPILDF